jgi:hypothetical protein
VGDWYQWEGKNIRKQCSRVHVVEILCTHVCKWKMRPVETIPGMGGREDKGEWWRG